MWTQHGGSGLGMTFADCEEIDLADAYDLFRRADERRTKEADAIREAGKTRPRG